MKWIAKFAASKFSGYALIALILSLLGSGIWFWKELKEYGSLTEKAANQADTIEEQRLTLNALAESIERKQRTLTAQQNRKDELVRNADKLRQEIREARDEAPQEYLSCRDVIVPERLRFGESREDSEGEA